MKGGEKMRKKKPFCCPSKKEHKIQIGTFGINYEYKLTKKCQKSC